MTSLRRSIRHILGQGMIAWGHRQTHEFEKTLRHCATVQKNLLTKILGSVESSEMALHFGISSKLRWDELCKQMSVISYEDLRPFILKAKSGVVHAVFSPDSKQYNIRMFATTSGTTSAPKWIPITGQALAVMRQSWLTWGYYIGQQHPKVAENGILSLTGSYQSTDRMGVQSTGSITGVLAQTLNAPLRLAMAVPPAVAAIESYGLRQYVTLRLAANTDSIRLIATANPSTLIQFADRLAQDQQVLISDLYDGTTQNIKQIPSHLQVSLYPKLHFQDKNRAKTLEKIAALRPLTPKDLWPNLELLGVWTGGHAAGYLPLLRKRYQDLTLRDHGLSATEGHMTIPFEDESDEGILNIHGAFYEFIEEDEIHETQPKTLLAHQIIKGKRYELVVSNFSGLIRYRMHDLVECTGFLYLTPLLRFISKTDLFTNLSGEKLSLWQVTEVINKLKDEAHLDFQEYLFSATLEPSPGYTCYLEFHQDFAHQPWKRLETRLDELLQGSNVEYRDKRKSKRLSSVRIVIIEPDTFIKMRDLNQKLTPLHAEQYKHPFLINNPKIDLFLKGFKSPPPQTYKAS